MERYISIKEVLDDLLDNPLLKDLTLERTINYTVNFIRIVGRPKAFVNKVTELNIEDYRALLPCDYINMIQVKDAKTNNVYRYTTDTFHLSNKDTSNDLTYKIQGQVIYTSNKQGTIEISYNAIPIDCDGYPMIIDNGSFKEALESYITKKRYRILFDTGQLNANVYNNICQEYSWLVGQAQSNLIMPSIDEMQSITNMWNTLIPRVTEHKYGFINNGSKETLLRQ